MPGSSNRRKPCCGLSIYWTNWLQNEGKGIISLILFVLIHFAVYAYTFYNYYLSGHYKTVVSLVGIGIPIAKGAAMCVKFDLGVFLFPVCRTLISKLRISPLNAVIPFDKNITFHRRMAYAMIFFAYVHTCAHYVNFMQLEKITLHSATWYAWESGPGLTGQIITISLFLLATSAAEPIRRKQHEMFWYTHHLFLFFFAALLFHGAFCLVKADTPPDCHWGGEFWYFFAGNGLAYALERLTREIRGRRETYITKLILHPAQVLEVQVKKPSAKVRSGQYIWINCPAVSTWQWHPFTLTSCPQEDFLSVHIRLVGDWTNAFAKACGVDNPKDPTASSSTTTLTKAALPWVLIDGPFGAASEDWLQFQVILCVGAGIGVTPFASILKAMFYSKRQNQPLKVQKIHFVWVCRETKAFEWFQSLLATIEKEFPQFIVLHLYLTANLKLNEINHVVQHDIHRYSDAITGLSSKTIYGRPNWDHVFAKLKQENLNQDIGVFFCGPKVLSQVLHKMSNKYSDAGTEGVRFYYHKENF